MVYSDQVTRFRADAHQHAVLCHPNIQQERQPLQQTHRLTALRELGKLYSSKDDIFGGGCEESLSLHLCQFSTACLAKEAPRRDKEKFPNNWPEGAAIHFFIKLCPEKEAQRN